MYGYEGDDHENERAFGVEFRLDDDHGDDIDVNTEGGGDGGNETQSAMGLISRLFAVVVGHGCCGGLGVFVDELYRSSFFREADEEEEADQWVSKERENYDGREDIFPRINMPRVRCASCSRQPILAPTSLSRTNR